MQQTSLTAGGVSRQQAIIEGISAHPTMPSTPECHQGQLFSGYLGVEYLVCGIHPEGPNETPCQDFAQVVEHWVPIGAAYYNGELILD